MTFYIRNQTIIERDVFMKKSEEGSIRFRRRVSTADGRAQQSRLNKSQDTSDGGRENASRKTSKDSIKTSSTRTERWAKLYNRINTINMLIGIQPKNQKRNSIQVSVF